MQVHSLKLNIQDVETADGHKIAALFGTLFLDKGEYEKNEEGNVLLDDAGEPIPKYETINFTDALNTNKEFKRCIQTMIIQALTLKNLEIAKEAGTLAHYVEERTGMKPKRGSRSTPAKKILRKARG